MIPFHNCHPGIKIFVRNVDKDTIHRIYIYRFFFNLKRKKNERESNREKERRNWIFFFFLSKRKFITFDSILQRDKRHSGSKISIQNVEKVTIPYGPGGIEGRIGK